MDEKTVKVWKITLGSGKTIRVATIEQGKRTEVDCSGCWAPCCRGSVMPVLTEEELFSRRFRTKFVEAPKWLKEKVPKAEYVAVIDVDPEKGCFYFDSKTRKCKLWPNPPKSCLSYDCKNDPRWEIRIWRKK
jgi:Fe-S-cluster containining protein